MCCSGIGWPVCRSGEGAANSPPGRVFSGGWPPQCAPTAAGASGAVPGRRLRAGPALAARRADAIYAVAWDLPAAQAYYRDIKRRVKAAGRRAPVPILPGLVTYAGPRTPEQAHAKQRVLDALLPVAASLRQPGLFTAQDCMNWELDAPVPSLPPLETFPGPKGR